MQPKCQFVRTVRYTHSTHVSPNDRGGHWRTITDRVEHEACPNPALVHVHVQFITPYPDTADMDCCPECAEAWQRRVRQMEGSQSTPWSKPSVWTYSPLVPDLDERNAAQMDQNVQVMAVNWTSKEAAL